LIARPSARRKPPVKKKTGRKARSQVIPTTPDGMAEGVEGRVSSLQ
jgi:hypothetical protein